MAPPGSWLRDVPAKTGGSVWRSSSITYCNLCPVTFRLTPSHGHGADFERARNSPSKVAIARRFNSGEFQLATFWGDLCVLVYPIPPQSHPSHVAGGFVYQEIV